MTFNRNKLASGLVATGMLAASLASGEVFAATSYSAMAEGTLVLNVAQPEDLSLADPSDLVVSFRSNENIMEDALGGTAFGDAEASGSSGLTLTGPVVGFEVMASATGSADATAPGTKEDSFVDAFAAFEITVTNNGSTGYTVFGDVTSSMTMSALFDDAINEYAEADAEFRLVGLSSGNLLASGGSTVDFFVAAGATETLFLEAYANGLSESFQPVPVPAALPLFASALIGGGIVGRRANRTV